ncbi:hypothetical protein CP532_4557 [Ophiocordyceps camponoti-leonardi (nom. inval.)]|nr:hypothetical protein CP532_4557 [Ophiocordyceps camponoti-leonardi (nom. inval.)]
MTIPNPLSPLHLVYLFLVTVIGQLLLHMSRVFDVADWELSFFLSPRHRFWLGLDDGWSLR